MNYLFDDLEEFALRSGDTAIPVELTENGAVIYHAVSEIFLKWNESFSDDPFSKNAVDDLKTSLCTVMKQYSFVPDDDTGTPLITYRYTSSNKIRSTDENTVILRTPGDIARYMFAAGITEISIDPDDEYCAVCCRISDGRIAAIAAVNDISNEGCPEIYVECAAEYRCNGYATACVSALAEYLTVFCGAEAVLYVCMENNLPSLRVAEKAGFKPKSRSVPFVFYRTPDK